MKKILKIILPIFIFFIGFSVSAKGTMFIGNGVVLNQCTGSTCAYPSGGTTNLRFIGDNTNFEVDHKYTFKLNFSATTTMASPTLTDCGLNINGAYVSPEARNSGRVNFECNSGYTRCDSTYASTIVYTIPSSLTNVPYFIQCDMNPSGTTYTYTNFTMSISDSNGSVIQAIDNNTDRMIETNNYNANENNKNRDSNSQMIGGKIDNNTNVIGGKLDSHANTISGKLQQIIDNLTNLGSTIISGISSTLESVGSTITQKVGELIGTQVVCNIYYQTKNSVVIYGDQNLTTGYINSNNGEVNSSVSSWFTTPFIKLSSNSDYSLFSSKDSGSQIRYAFYSQDKSFISSGIVSNGGTFDFSISNNNNFSYIRYSFPTAQSTTILKGDCQRTGIAGLFNKFTQFVSNFFSPNIDDANSLGSSEFNNFTTTNVGLRGLLDTLVTFVNNIFNSTCSPLVLPLPFVDNTVTLPCMSGIYTTYFPTFFHIYQLITTGLIAYRVIINLFHKVHQLEDVNYDKVEVLSL